MQVEKGSVMASIPRRLNRLTISQMLFWVAHPARAGPRRAQVNWTRYLMAMRERSKFTRAVGATTGVMTAMYLLIGARPPVTLGACARPVQHLPPDSEQHVGISVHGI